MEYFDIYDKNRNKTGKVILRGERMQDDEYHLFVQVWLLNDKGKFLVQKRSEFVRWPHMWCANGGNVKAGEESFETCKREMMEELGIDVNDFEGGLFDSRIYLEDGQNYFCDSYLYKCNKDPNEFILQKEEVEEVKYMDIDEIIDLMNKNEFFVYDLDYLQYLKEIANKEA